MAMSRYQIQYVKPWQNLRKMGKLWWSVKNTMKLLSKVMDLEESKTKYETQFPHFCSCPTPENSTNMAPKENAHQSKLSLIWVDDTSHVMP